MVCRYTDPDGNQFDCIVHEVEGGQAYIQAYIQYRPIGKLATVSRWVNYFSLSVPR